MTRRLLLAIAIVVGAGGPAAANPPPPIEDAIADARAAGKLLVVELHATWCKPCTWFEKYVLPDPDVVAALAKVHFVRYDVDTPGGQRVADRYATRGVPAFLVIDDGAVVARQLGVGGRDAKTSARWFATFVTGGDAASRELAALLQRIQVDPRDALAQLALARLYRAKGDRRRAREHYSAVVDAVPSIADPQAVAAAVAELGELVAAEARVAAAVEDATRFARRYPESPLATPRLALAAVSDRVGVIELRLLLRHHVEALPRGPALAEALRLALALRMSDLVEDALATWTRAYPDALHPRLVRIEMALLDGKKADAARAARALCTDPPIGIELECHLLREGRSRLGARRLLSRASSELAGLLEPGHGSGDPDVHRLDELIVVDPERGNAIARALRLASARCRDHADDFELAIARFDPDEPVEVEAKSDRAEDCVRAALREHVLPEPRVALAGGVTDWIELGTRPEGRRGAPLAVPPRQSGVLGTMFARLAGSELAAAGAGFQGVIGLGRAADFRGEVAWDVQLGATDDRSLHAVARGYAGLAIGTAGWQLSSLIGLGASHGGPSWPAGLEVPLVLRIDLDAGGGKRLHGWVRGARIYGAPSRVPAMPSGFFGMHELSIGGGARVGGWYLGIELEERAGESATLLSFGRPIGEFF